MESQRQIYQLLGELLDYPTASLLEKSRRGLELMSSLRPGAALLMREFAAFVETRPIEALEELYTAAFDLSPDCCLYVAYQLVGEDPKRAALMLKLQEEYRAAGFDAGRELPDHLGVMLRFLGRQGDEVLNRDLAELAILPALKKMIAGLQSDNPYRTLLRVVEELLAPATVSGGFEILAGEQTSTR